MIIRNGNPKNIAIHHSAVHTTTGDMAELKKRAASYDAYHKDKSIGWNNTTNGEFGYKYIRYHYMIARDGSLLQVQDDKYVLYHSSDGANGDFNYWGIAIVFDGNYMEEKPTEAMMKTAVELIRRLQTKYNIDPMVRGHKEVAAATAPTSCPGVNLGTSTSGWVRQLIDNVNNNNYPPVTPPVTPPVDPTIELQRQIETLKLENKGLTEALAASQRDTQLALDRVSLLEGNLELREREMAELEVQLDRITEERNRFEKEKNELLMQGTLAGATTGVLFAELWKRITRSIRAVFAELWKRITRSIR